MKNEGHREKMWNPRWRPRNGCDSVLMENFLITTIQVNLCCLLHISLWFGTKFTWIVVIKNFAISLPFLGHHLGFHIFFHIGLLGVMHFLQLGCFGLDFTSFCNCILCSYRIAAIKYLPLFVFFSFCGYQIDNVTGFWKITHMGANDTVNI